MWEGQNARGLFNIYCKLQNGSEQIKYAQKALDAFTQGGYEDWANFANLNLQKSYANHGEFDRALMAGPALLKTAEDAKDTLLLAEVRNFIATCQYSLDNYEESLKNYYAAYCLDSTIITPKLAYNIIVSKYKVNIDTLPDGMKNFLDKICIRRERIPVFKELEKQGKFEEAYYGLERYTAIQDSVLQEILHNNVSESIAQYESLKNILRYKDLKNERICWAVSIFALLVLIVAFRVFYKNRLAQRTLEVENLKHSLDIVRSDFVAQVNYIDEILTDNRRMSEKNSLMSVHLRKMLYDKYRKANELCDSYFQDKNVKSKKNKLEKEIESLLKDFNNQDFLKEIGSHIDYCFDGLYSSFVSDFPNLKEEIKNLFMLLTLGLSPRTISVIFDIELSNFYNRKSRLKKLLSESDVERKAEYMKNMA